MFSRKLTILIFSKNTQNCFPYNSATKFRSEAVLYTKRTAGYPLSPRIKTIAVARFQKITNKLTDWQTLTLSSTWDSWTITCLKMCLPNGWRNFYVFIQCWQKCLHKIDDICYKFVKSFSLQSVQNGVNCGKWMKILKFFFIKSHCKFQWFLIIILNLKMLKPSETFCNMCCVCKIFRLPNI